MCRSGSGILMYYKLPDPLVSAHVGVILHLVAVGAHRRSFAERIRTVCTIRGKSP